MTENNNSFLIVVVLFYQGLCIAAIGMMDTLVVYIVPVDEGIEMVLLRLLVEYFFQLGQLFREFFCQVVTFVKIFV